jgi:rfaE bifunctional protein kinase chain/domain
MTQHAAPDQFLPWPRLQAILSAAPALRIGVVGDFTLDAYWITDMTRSVLSRETPLFPRPVVRERYTCGGAANVAWNLAALGLGRVRSFTVLGPDWRGVLLRKVLGEVGVDSGDALAAEDWSTPLFGKVILRAGELHQEDARLDFINSGSLSPDVEETLLTRLEETLPELDALVVADYQPVGVITSRVLDGLNDLARRFPQVVFTVDSRERVGQFQGMVRKPNQVEAARWLLPGHAPELMDLQEFAGEALHPQVDCGCPLVITLGERGSLVLANGESHLVPAIPVAPPIDTVGAGDSFLAALTLGLAAGASPVEAARLGHLAASVTVRKLGITGAATPEEVLAAAGPVNRPAPG